MTTGMTTVSGRVVDAGGVPVSGARVFAEQGLGAALMSTQSDASGQWSFAGLASAQVGVFAIGDGYGFCGATVKGGLGAQVTDVTLTLRPAGNVSGVVTDAKGKPVAGARITRIVLAGADKVAIPLSKLRSEGFGDPESDAEGRFVLQHVPQGETLILKVAHPAYAQEAANDIPVGATDVKIALYDGALVEGEVQMREGHLPVADVAVLVRNAQPPHDTAVTKTDARGQFALRLKPGVYACQAVASNLQSPGWFNLTVPAEGLAPHPTLYVAGVGRIRGKVGDAKTGQPIEGARLYLDTLGNMAAAAITGPSGEYAFTPMEGSNVVRLDSAAGYLPPEQPALTVPLKPGEDRELPAFWLVPIPGFTVEAVDDAGRPVANAVVSVLWPQQFGWRLTDGAGRAILEFGSVPPEGSIGGTIECLNPYRTALFAIEQTKTDPAKVQLFPGGAVQGRIVNEEGEPVEGAIVAGLVGEQGIPMWRTLTGPDGCFGWNACVSQVPLYCRVQDAAAKAEVTRAVTLDAGAKADLGNITLSGAAQGRSWLGQKLDRASLRPVQGGDSGIHDPAVYIFCAPDEAAVVSGSMESVRTAVHTSDIRLALVVDGAPPALGGSVPVFTGKPPGGATTYLTDAQGRVALETFGLPPLQALAELASAK